MFATDTIGYVESWRTGAALFSLYGVAGGMVRETD